MAKTGCHGKGRKEIKVGKALVGDITVYRTIKKRKFWALNRKKVLIGKLLGGAVSQLRILRQEFEPTSNLEWS
ncbi:unnamed protein product, partial [Dovyalis caffra]